MENMNKLLLLLAILSIEGFAITSFDRDITQSRVGGYMDTEWVSSDEANTFKAHRFILQVGSRISDKVLFNSEIELEYGGYITDEDVTATSDDVTNGEIKVEQAWVDYKTDGL
tara:strand:- start:29 stop:367 length:339 start_codon:yes stop_codon:yes gene_type:complete